MCSCSERALENEPEISFEDVDGNPVDYDMESWGSVPEYQVLGVKLKWHEFSRNEIIFAIRST